VINGIEQETNQQVGQGNHEERIQLEGFNELKMQKRMHRPLGSTAWTIIRGEAFNRAFREK
jgi:hypothetical protein